MVVFAPYLIDSDSHVSLYRHEFDEINKTDNVVEKSKLIGNLYNKMHGDMEKLLDIWS